MAWRAAELGRDDSAVLWMCAYAVWRLDLNAPQARELAHRSLALNPNSAGALNTTAYIETFCGNHSKALELYDRAERLSPRDPRGWFAATGRAFIYLFENDLHEALSWAQKALIQNPRLALALRVRAAILALLGQHDNAAAAMQEALRVEPHVTISQLRSRTVFLDKDLWSRYSEGLRLAGLGATHKNYMRTTACGTKRTCRMIAKRHESVADRFGHPGTHTPQASAG